MHFQLIKNSWEYKMQLNVEQKEWGLHNEGIKALVFFSFFLMRSEGLKSKQVSII